MEFFVVGVLTSIVALGFAFISGLDYQKGFFGPCITWGAFATGFILLTTLVFYLGIRHGELPEARYVLEAGQTYEVYYCFQQNKKFIVLANKKEVGSVVFQQPLEIGCPSSFFIMRTNGTLEEVAKPSEDTPE